MLGPSLSYPARVNDEQVDVGRAGDRRTPKGRTVIRREGKRKSSTPSERNALRSTRIFVCADPSVDEGFFFLARFGSLTVRGDSFPE